MSESQTYYVRRRGKTDGPWPLTKLRSEVALKKLGRYDELSPDGKTWQRAGDVEGLFVQEVARKSAAPAAAAGDRRSAYSTAPASSDEYELRPETGRAAASPLPASASTGDASWYLCGDDNQPLGPITLEQVAKAVAAGRATRDTLVWRDGFLDWIPIGSAPEVLDAVERSSALRSSSSRYVSDEATTAASYAADEPPRTSTKASVALGIGIFALTFSCIPLLGISGVAAVIFGILANQEIARGRGYVRGSGLATWGIVSGLIGAAIGALWIPYLVIVAFAAAADAQSMSS